MTRANATTASIGAAEATTRNAVIALILITSALRLLFAQNLDLGVDESYTVATSRQLQLGYFDHPPLAWWLTALARGLTGSEHRVLIRLPFICAFALTIWFTYHLTRLLYGRSAGFWAAVAVNISPVIAWTSGTWVLPDGPLYAALLGGTYAVARVLFLPEQSPWWWLAAGVGAGVAMLSKLHGVFLPAGVFLFLLTTPRHRRWLATPWPYAAALVALLLFTPALLWNAEHDWISFRFQAARGEVTGLHLKAFFGLVIAQMLYVLPIVWVTSVALLGMALAAGPARPRDWLLACIAVGPIVVFTLSGLTARHVLPHWSAPGFLMLAPLLGRFLGRGTALGRGWVKHWIGLTAGTTAVLYVAILVLAHVPWPRIPLPNGRLLQDPLEEMASWSDLPKQLRERGLLDDKLVIVTYRWHEAGRIDYALRGRVPVLCVCDDPRGYGVNIRNLDYLGRDALILGEHLDLTPAPREYAQYFARLEPLPAFEISRGGGTRITLVAYRGHGLRTAPAEAAPLDLLDPLGMWTARK